MQLLRDLIVARPLVLCFWIFVVGSAIGSFLNVVVYRLPRGISLSHPGSHCPHCKHPIRWYHNLPIMGWFLLGGRCHDCKAAISPRYPAVELVVAVIFPAFAYFDIYWLIARQAAEAPNADKMLHGLWVALGAFAAHVWLACTLLAAVLMRWDGKKPPGRLTAIGLVVAGGIAPFLDTARAAVLLALAAVLLVVALVNRSGRISV